VIEYKSAKSYSDDDSKEKRMIGDFYSSINKKNINFLMLNGKDWVTLKKVLD